MGTLGSVKFANEPNRLIRIKMVRFEIAIKITRHPTYAYEKELAEKLSIPVSL